MNPLDMQQVDATAVLRELLALTRRSFPQYLRHARQYRVGHDDEALSVIDDIVADQNILAERVAEQLERRGQITSSAEFPMAFTDSHDLAIEYLINRAIEHQRDNIATLEQLSESLACHQSIRSLVDETRGMARAHLESLEECRAGA